MEALYADSVPPDQGSTGAFECHQDEGPVLPAGAPQRRFQRGGSRVRRALMIFAAPHLDSWLAGHLAGDQSGDKN